MTTPSYFDRTRAYQQLIAHWPGGEADFLAFLEANSSAVARVEQTTSAPPVSASTELGARIDPEAFYRPEEAAQVTPWSTRTFEAWRSRGEGPAFLKVAGRVLYHGADLRQFLEKARRPDAAERRKIAARLKERSQTAR